MVILVASAWLLIIGAIIIAITAVILIIIYWKKILLKLVEWTLNAAGALDKAWEWIKDSFIIAWETMKNVFIKIWNSIISYYESAINTILEGINAVIRGINKIPGINIPIIPKVDLGGLKGQLTDIGALKTSLQLEREARAGQFAAATTQIFINVEGSLIREDELVDTISEKTQDKLNTMIST